MKKLFLILLFLPFLCGAKKGSLADFADSIRKAYHIPELGFAVVSADSVYEMKVLGVTKMNATRKAALTDKFRIGYAYDITVSSLKNFSSHEISLGYYFFRKQDTKMLSPRYF